MQPILTTVDQRITILDGFISQHRHGSSAQITESADVLLKNLTAGELISESLMRAEAAFNAIDPTIEPEPVIRHFAGAVDLGDCRRAA